MSFPMNTAAGPVKVPKLLNNDGQVRWKAAAPSRRGHSCWIVIWPAMQAEFQARPLFRAPRGTVMAVLLPGSSPPA
jgi:hypothetical protein